jgi:hypothetical protein
VKNWIIPLFLSHLLLATGAFAEQTPLPQRVAPSGKEAEYLRNYALLICASKAYERLRPPPGRIIKLLRAEAWVFVEKGSLGPEAYETLYELSAKAGKSIPAEAAIRGCLQWRENETLRRFIAAATTKG